MAVVEAQQHAVIADRFDRADVDVALAGDQHLLPGAVALHFGARRFHAQVFARQAVAAAVVERDLEDVRRLVQRQLGRPGPAHRM